MKKNAFTLMEMIIVIVIIAILSTGAFIAMDKLYIRAEKTKIISQLSFESQIVSDQISSLLYDRIPYTAIGYNPSKKDFQSIYDIDEKFTVLEWIGRSIESFYHKDYSGFIDLDDSDKDKNETVSFGMNLSNINATVDSKFGAGSVSDNDIALIFSGSFDEGVSGSDFNNSFGWHGYDHKIIYDINITDNNISFGQIRPKSIYEKYYLVDSGYAVARGEDIDLNSSCIKNLAINNINNNTLFLFYNFRPWKGETFCADPNTDIDGHTSTKAGNVTILSNDVEGFETGLINNGLYFNLTLNKALKGADQNITISKQKVIF